MRTYLCCERSVAQQSRPRQTAVLCLMQAHLPWWVSSCLLPMLTVAAQNDSSCTGRLRRWHAYSTGNHLALLVQAGPTKPPTK